ncbi:MAG: ATP-binding cassette domain-containing protein, partial [candidate division NC10 bacterium]|nr:ATP-binding cassette domain-containing protein [candidate division NC10 bacterium]
MIRIRGLRKVFPPDKLALAGVDLDIAAGEFVMIIGQSGAGKTTLLRCLNRLVEPDGGRRHAERVAGDGRLARGAPIRAAADRGDLPAVQPGEAGQRAGERPGGPPGPRPRILQPRRPVPRAGSGAGPGLPAPGRTGGVRLAPSGHPVRRGAAAGGYRPGAGPGAQGDPGRRAHRQPGPQADREHHGHPPADQRGAAADAGGEPAHAGDGPDLRDAHRGPA